ncbi:hypothetical protein FKP32DRAFT_838754 [Trametes sanguinea]|nr:hypothetical protein FKP32DRAFT_838754 [Trametes sanguinea]
MKGSEGGRALECSPSELGTGNGALPPASEHPARPGSLASRCASAPSFPPLFLTSLPAACLPDTCYSHEDSPASSCAPALAVEPACLARQTSRRSRGMFISRYPEVPLSSTHPSVHPSINPSACSYCLCPHLLLLGSGVLAWSFLLPSSPALLLHLSLSRTHALIQTTHNRTFSHCTQTSSYSTVSFFPSLSLSAPTLYCPPPREEERRGAEGARGVLLYCSISKHLLGPTDARIPNVRTRTCCSIYIDPFLSLSLFDSASGTRAGLGLASSRAPSKVFYRVVARL